MHIVAGYQRAVTFLHPGYLRFLVPVQVGVKMGYILLLGNDALIVGYRYGELQYLHQKILSKY